MLSLVLHGDLRLSPLGMGTWGLGMCLCFQMAQGPQLKDRVQADGQTASHHTRSLMDHLRTAACFPL